MYTLGKYIFLSRILSYVEIRHDALTIAKHDIHLQLKTYPHAHCLKPTKIRIQRLLRYTSKPSDNKNPATKFLSLSFSLCLLSVPPPLSLPVYLSISFPPSVLRFLPPSPLPSPTPLPLPYQMDKPLVRKNLPALAEQMQNVAGQLRSVAASAELFKMVARTRNIISNTLYPLEKRKVMALGVVPWEGAWETGRGWERTPLGSC